MAAKKKVAEKKTAVVDVAALLGQLAKDESYHEVILEKKKPEDFLSTGSLTFDLKLGGGFYGGQILQVYGVAHSGKSTMGYTATGELTTRGVPVAFMDFEGTTDRAYAETLGVDFSKITYMRPESGEAGYKFMVDFCKALPDKHSGEAQAVIVIDTIAAMTPQKWIESPENKQQGVRAAMHSKGFSQLQTLMTNKHVSILAINQVRSSAGAMYTSPEVLPGGNAWGFATATLVRLARGESIELPNGMFLQGVKYKTQKNKTFIPQQEAQIHLELGEGYDIASDLMNFGKETGYWYKRGKGGQRVIGKGLPSIDGLNQILIDNKEPTTVKILSEAMKAKEAKAKEKDPKAKVEPLTTEEIRAVLNCDQDFKSQAAFEECVRSQGKDGLIYKACKIAMTTGVAVEIYRKSKNKLELDDSDEVKSLTDLKKKKVSNLGSGSEFDDDDDDEDED